MEIDNPAGADGILRELGFVPVVEVKKVRQKCRYKEYEICLDEVDKLGTFIELEKMTEDDADPSEVMKELYSELESLGLSRDDEETRGYDTQMYQLENTK